MRRYTVFLFIALIGNLVDKSAEKAVFEEDRSFVFKETTPDLSREQQELLEQVYSDQDSDDEDMDPNEVQLPAIIQLIPDPKSSGPNDGLMQMDGRSEKSDAGKARDKNDDNGYQEKAEWKSAKKEDTDELTIESDGWIMSAVKMLTDLVLG